MLKILLSLSWFFLPYLTKSQNLSFSLGGNFTSGNLLSYGFNTKSNLNYNLSKNNQIVFTPSFDYGRISNQQGVFELRRKELLSILNYERTEGRLKFYIYSELENSFLRKIKLRGSFGTGISYKLNKSESTNFDISQFILPELYLSSFSNQRDNWAIRSSTRIRFSKTFEKNKYSSQILFQPAIYTQMIDGTKVKMKNNTIIRINSSYEYILSKNLSIGFSTDVVVQTYSSFINPMVKPFDTNMNLYIRGSY